LRPLKYTCASIHIDKHLVSISSTFLRTNFSYEHCFSSFYYIHAARKSCRNDVHTKNSYIKHWWNWHRATFFQRALLCKIWASTLAATWRNRPGTADSWESFQLTLRGTVSRRCQFHQHFTFEFYVQMSLWQIFYVHVTEKSCRNNIRKKNLYVKCWWNWPLARVLRHVRFNLGIQHSGERRIMSL